MLVAHRCDFVLWCPGASALRRLRVELEARSDVFVCLEPVRGKAKTARAGTKARESTSDRSGVPTPAHLDSLPSPGIHKKIRYTALHI